MKKIVSLIKNIVTILIDVVESLVLFIIALPMTLVLLLIVWSHGFTLDDCKEMGEEVMNENSRWCEVKEAYQPMYKDSLFMRIYMWAVLRVINNIVEVIYIIFDPEYSY